VIPQVLFVPLLAFDREGYRLGYGGGFYDRSLAELRSAGAVLAIGLAYAGQEVARVPRGPKDQRLDRIVTETETIEIG
jgi:5-formyltetrahydrofolate cyclo-ligase